MVYSMRLQHQPFLLIKSGRKTIEMRLNDNKRKLLNEGDMVEFTDVNTGEMLVCEVVKLHHYASFEELYKNHDKISIGYTDDEVADPKDMLVYYPLEEIKQCGVVGIEIKMLQGDGQ